MSAASALGQHSVSETRLGGPSFLLLASFGFQQLHSIPDYCAVVLRRVGCYGVRSSLFSFLATTLLIDSADWVRLVLRASSAVPPRWSAPPPPGPERSR